MRPDSAAYGGGVVSGAVMAPAFDLIPYLVPCVLVTACVIAMIAHKD